MLIITMLRAEREGLHWLSQASLCACSAAKPTTWTVSVLTPTMTGCGSLQPVKPAAAEGLQPLAPAAELPAFTPGVNNIGSAPSEAASEPGVSTSIAAEQAASHHGTAIQGLALEACTAGASSRAVTSPHAAGSAAAAIQLPCGLAELKRQQTDPAARAVADAGDLEADAAATQLGSASAVAEAASGPPAALPGSAAAQQAEVGAPPANQPAAGQALLNQLPSSASAAESTVPPQEQTISEPAPHLQIREAGVDHEPVTAGEQRLPLQRGLVYDNQAAAVAAFEQTSLQAGTASAGCVPEEVRGNVADLASSVGSAPAAWAASQLLHFDHVAVRGRNMRVPQGLADTVAASLPDHEQRVATVQVTLPSTFTLAHEP